MTEQPFARVATRGPAPTGGLRTTGSPSRSTDDARRAATTDAPVLSVQNVAKRFGPVEAVKEISLDVARDEFVALLGPSGSGKTTLLRILSGLEKPDRGSVVIGGRDVTALPPYLRNIGMVFQDFLLLPHRTVGENIAFPLRMQNKPVSVQRQQLEWVLNLVRLTGLEGRYPHQLSGGQKQRVALARGLVARPEVLLLDEPLANLDRELRKEMEIEVRRFQKELDIPFIYVTHNQEEALTMSDRVAVMNHGRFEQEGRKMDIYDRPATRFVASFVGSPNKLSGIVVGRQGDGYRIDCGGLVFAGQTRESLAAGDRVDVFLKSERISLGSASDNEVVGVIRDVIFKGQFSDYFVRVGQGIELVVSGSPVSPGIERGGTVTLGWSVDAADIFANPGMS